MSVTATGRSDWLNSSCSQALVGETAMTRYKVLFVGSNPRASALILNALHEADLSLRVVFSASQLSLVCACAFDVIAIMGEHSECCWVGHLKLISPRTAVVLLCSGRQTPNSFLPPVDAVCSKESPRLAVQAILSAALALSLLQALRPVHPALDHHTNCMVQDT
jgi:hypothetical protein